VPVFLEERLRIGLGHDPEPHRRSCSPRCVD
jgi:hypothetical protein